MADNIPPLPFWLDPTQGSPIAGLQPAEPAPAPAQPPSSGPGFFSLLGEMLSAAGMAATPTFDPSTVPPANIQIPQSMSVIGGSKPGVLESNDRVYMGHETTIVGETDNVRPERTTTTPKSMTVQQAVNLPYVWAGSNPKKLADLEKKMRQAGYNIPAGGNTLDTVSQIWSTLVQQASTIYTQSNGSSLVTPFDLLSTQQKHYADHGHVDENGNIVTKATSTQVNKMSEGQAWQLVRSTVQQMLGQDPTDQEVRDFLSMANADAARDPASRTTTTTTNAKTGKVIDTNSVTDPGYTSQDAAQAEYEKLHNSADYAAYQSAGTIFNWIQAALGEVA